MTAINLKNITIKKLEDKNFKTYFLIVNNDNQDEAFFCFSGAVKSGWENLTSNWENIREIEIEYTENNNYKKVVNVYADGESEILI